MQKVGKWLYHQKASLPSWVMRLLLYEESFYCPTKNSELATISFPFCQKARKSGLFTQPYNVYPAGLESGVVSDLLHAGYCCIEVVETFNVEVVKVSLLAGKQACIRIFCLQLF